MRGFMARRVERLLAEMQQARIERGMDEKRRREQEQARTTSHIVTRYPTAGGAEMTLQQVRTPDEVRLIAECGGCGGTSGMREAREWGSDHAKKCTKQPRRI